MDRSTKYRFRVVHPETGRDLYTSALCYDDKADAIHHANAAREKAMLDHGRAYLPNYYIDTFVITKDCTHVDEVLA